MKVGEVLMVLGRYPAYSRLKPIAVGLPRRLAEAYGAGERYTFLQVKRAISDLKLSEDAAPYALAAACSLEDLEKADAGLSAQRYQQLRAELADIFNLPAGFTMKHLGWRPRSAGGTAGAAGLAAAVFGGWFGVGGSDSGGGDGGGGDGGGGGGGDGGG